MTEQDLIHKIEWANKRCSLKGEPLTQTQIELLKFVFADTVVNKNLTLSDVSGALPLPYTCPACDGECKTEFVEVYRCTDCTNVYPERQ